MMLLHTTQGIIDASELARTVGFDETDDAYVVWVEWRLADELVRRDHFRQPKHFQPGETNARIFTTHGLVDAAAMTRRLTFTDSPDEFTIVSQWLLFGEEVRRDARVILKQASVTAVGAVGGF